MERRKRSPNCQEMLVWDDNVLRYVTTKNISNICMPASQPTCVLWMHYMLINDFYEFLWHRYTYCIGILYGYETNWEQKVTKCNTNLILSHTRFLFPVTQNNQKLELVGVTSTHFAFLCNYWSIIDFIDCSHPELVKSQHVPSLTKETF